MKGRKTGGRKPGVRNKTTLEKERLANEAAARAMDISKIDPSKPMAKDVLENVMFALLSMANDHKPPQPGEGVKQDPDRNAIFFQCMQLTVTAAKALAAHQSPTFKAIEYRPVMPVMPESQRNGDDAKVIDIKDHKIQSQIYMRLIKHRSTK